jgi:hypothetical protein
MAWCGASVVATMHLKGGSVLQRINLEGGESETLGAVSSPTPLACSPDGTAVVHAGIAGSEAVLVLRNLTTNETQELDVDLLTHPRAEWVPDWVPPVVRAVEALDPSVTLDWGHRRRVEAMVRFSDGSWRQDLVAWEALDPEVVSVNRNGVITANREGRARVVAGWGHSFRDTVEVEVTHGGSGSAFLRDRFLGVDTTRWLPIGYPHPVAVEQDGRSVLYLNGNEKYTDGLVLRTPIPMERGVTVEWEFHLDPTRSVHQSFSACLLNRGPDWLGPAAGNLDLGSSRTCFRYPARELAHFDPAEGVLEVPPSVSTWVRLPGALPASDWTAVALQVRPDGEVSLFLNREHVATSPVSLVTEGTGGWFLLLDGKSVGADTFLRDLVIWEEVRYRTGN